MFQDMSNFKKCILIFPLTDNLFEIKFFFILALFLHHEITLHVQYSHTTKCITQEKQVNVQVTTCIKWHPLPFFPNRCWAAVYKGQSRN